MYFSSFWLEIYFACTKVKLFSCTTNTSDIRWQTINFLTLPNQSQMSLAQFKTKGKQTINQITVARALPYLLGPTQVYNFVN